MADQFQVKIVWQSDQHLVAGRRYKLRYGEQLFDADITSLKYREISLTGEKLPAKSVGNNETVIANVSLSGHLSDNFIALSPAECGFDLSDPLTGESVGAGVFQFALYRATNIRWQTLHIDKTARALMKGQRPRCVWFTGLSGSGKSTLADLLEKRLYEHSCHTYLLDGDNVRHGLNRDLGFTEADRVENIRRVAEVAKLMLDAGLIVLASFISPFRADRTLARSLFAESEFIEVYVDTDLAECERRDVKGLYAKARRGELKNFTGIDSPYEVPDNPEIVVNTQRQSPEECVDIILSYLNPSASH
jgi:bifunctional enzyme CysN/CysC